MAAVEVADRVWAVDQSVVEGKNGVVAGRERAVEIDTGNKAEDGQVIVDAAERNARAGIPLNAVAWRDLRETAVRVGAGQVLYF